MLPPLAERSGSRFWLRGPRLCADDQPRPPAAHAIRIRRSSTSYAIPGPALRAVHQSPISTYRRPVGRPLQVQRGPGRDLSAGLYALHRTQPRTRRHGGRSRRLPLVQLPGQRPGPDRRPPDSAPDLSRARCRCRDPMRSLPGLVSTATGSRRHPRRSRGPQAGDALGKRALRRSDLCPAVHPSQYRQARSGAER